MSNERALQDISNQAGDFSDVDERRMPRLLPLLLSLGVGAVLSMISVQAAVSLTLKSTKRQHVGEKVAFNLISVPRERQLESRERAKPKPPEPKPLNSPVTPIKVEAKPLKMKPLARQTFRPAFGPSSGVRVSASYASVGPVRGVIPVYQSPPEYPYKAKQRGIEGVVELEFTITKNGTVKDIEVVRADPPRVFNHAAKQALSRWKFSPQLSGGVPVEKRAIQEMVFQLGGRR